MEIKADQTFIVDYPFYIEDGALLDMDEDGPVIGKSWRPGAECTGECPYRGVDEWYANGMGKVIYKAVSIHKPGKYPERVFYTRQYKDPRGKIFGKTNLHITTTQNFKKLLNGYRYDYILDKDEI